MTALGGFPCAPLSPILHRVRHPTRTLRHSGLKDLLAPPVEMIRFIARTLFSHGLAIPRVAGLLEKTKNWC